MRKEGKNCSSIFGAVSFAYCQECLDKPADCIGMFNFLYDEISDHGEGLIDEINQWFSWIDGQYISWPDYVKLRKNERTEETKSE